MIPYKEIGPRLKVLASIKKISQENIAKQCGISRISVHRFFKGQTELKCTDFINLCSVIGVNIYEPITECIRKELLVNTQ